LGKYSYDREMNRIHKLFHYATKYFYCFFRLFKSEFSTILFIINLHFLVVQAIPPAVRSMPHLRYLELAANPITTLSNAVFQGAMEHLQELDIRHLTLNYFEVK